MIVAPADCPDLIQAFETAAGLMPLGGTWLRAQTAGAYALLYHDSSLLLHHIEADTPGSGRGSVLLGEILEWADTQGLVVHLICETDRVAWYRRHGFTVVRPAWAAFVMSRNPARRP